MLFLLPFCLFMTAPANNLAGTGDARARAAL